MSSILTQQQMHLEKKRQKLTRTSSIDRIIQFNMYICSQNFYLLPAIISWLKSSQTVLQSHIDKYTNLLKSTVFNVLLLALITVRRCSFSLYRTASTRLTAVSVYFALLVIFMQLLVCLYVVFNVYLSVGVGFLIACIHLISYLNLMLSLHYLKTENNKNKFRY